MRGGTVLCNKYVYVEWPWATRGSHLDAFADNVWSILSAVRDKTTFIQARLYRGSIVYGSVDAVANLLLI